MGRWESLLLSGSRGGKIVFLIHFYCRSLSLCECARPKRARHCLIYSIIFFSMPERVRTSKLITITGQMRRFFHFSSFVWFIPFNLGWLCQSLFRVLYRIFFLSHTQTQFSTCDVNCAVWQTVFICVLVASNVAAVLDLLSPFLRSRARDGIGIELNTKWIYLLSFSPLWQAIKLLPSFFFDWFDFS